MRSPTEVPTAQLTARQREILAFVNEHSAQHGYPPTVREIGTAVGLTSSSTVHAHLANLERLGLLRRDPAKPRALNLVGRSSRRCPPVARDRRHPHAAAARPDRRGRSAARRGARRGAAAGARAAHGLGRELPAARTRRVDDRRRHPQRRLRRRAPPGHGRERRDRRRARRWRRGHGQADLPRGAAASACSRRTSRWRRSTPTTSSCSAASSASSGGFPRRPDARPGTPTRDPGRTPSPTRWRRRGPRRCATARSADAASSAAA